MRQIVLWAFGIGVFALALALIVAPMITATTADTTATNYIDENESVSLTDTLSLAVTDINTSGTEYMVTLEATDENTLSTAQTTLNTTENATIQLSGDAINVNVDDRGTDTALVSATYPPAFGWNGGARAMLDNLGVVIVITAVIMVLGLLGWHI